MCTWLLLENNNYWVIIKRFNDKGDVRADRARKIKLKREIQTVEISVSSASFKWRLRLALRAWVASILSTNFLPLPFFSFCIRVCASSTDNWCFLLNAPTVDSVKASTSAYIYAWTRVITTHWQTKVETKIEKTQLSANFHDQWKWCSREVAAAPKAVQNRKCVCAKMPDYSTIQTVHQLSEARTNQPTNKESHLSIQPNNRRENSQRSHRSNYTKKGLGRYQLTKIRGQRGCGYVAVFVNILMLAIVSVYWLDP